MNTVQWNPLKVKSLLGLQGMAEDAAFVKLGNYISIREVSSQTIIRHAGTVETESHVLEKGLIGMFRNGKLIRVFFEGDMFLDFDSYREQIPSRFEFRALMDSCFTVLTYEDEKLVLQDLPEFKEVSEYLISKVRNSNEQWVAFSQLPYEDRLRELELKVSNLRFILKIKELASLLGISNRSVTRLRSRESHQGGGENWKESITQKIGYPFKHSRHAQANQLEALAISWACDFHSFLCDPEEVKRFQKSKLGLLSTYLYPEIDFDKGLWINKLYVWLFFLDDKTDQLIPGSKERFWKLILDWVLVFWGKERGNPPFLPSKIASIANAFQDLWMELEQMDQVSKVQIELIQAEIQAHLHYSWIEAGFRDRGAYPSLEDYLEYKPYFSGAKLAVSLTCLEFEDQVFESDSLWQETASLRDLGAKLIFLDNDLISYKKEQAIGDHMNYLALLVLHNSLSPLEAKEKVLAIRTSVLQDFMAENKRWMEDFNPENHLILQKLKYIKFKIAASAFWSLKISNRYE
ncbi:terpene synthase family protein [Algoriphagus namhaensis]